MRGLGSRAFRPLRGRVTFLSLSKERLTQRMTPRATRPPRIHALRVRVRRRDFSTAHPCADEKRCTSCASHCGSIRRHPPLRRGPEKRRASCPQGSGASDNHRTAGIFDAPCVARALEVVQNTLPPGKEPKLDMNEGMSSIIRQDRTTNFDSVFGMREDCVELIPPIGRTDQSPDGFPWTIENCGTVRIWNDRGRLICNKKFLQ